MSIDREMDEEDVVYIYNGISLSHKNEWNSVICKDMNRPRYCHTESKVSQKEEKNIIYHLSMESRKLVEMNLLGKQNGTTDVVNKLTVIKGRRGGGVTWEIEIHIYT